ncbi:VWA domain-containing protein [Falsibacillus pallidus]|uniref:VWA domain-containing protein n=1 Tax=Falsibacillus pallidus TaxID=493781 RepID=UPI003D99BCE4
MRIIAIAFLFTISVLLTGCNSEKTAEPKQKTVQKEETVDKYESHKKSNPETNGKYFENLPETPKTTRDVINQLPGKYANQEVLDDKVEPKVIEDIKNLPPMPKGVTEDDYDKYYQYIYSLAANDFPDPEDLVKKWKFSMYGNSDLQDPKYHFKDNYNVEVILDSSGSMAKKVGGKTQMELAKEAINDFASSLPKDVNISLRVYGYKGTGSDSDKQESCSSIKQVYGFKGYNQSEFNQAMDRFKPSGWTPIAQSLKESFESFKGYDQKTNTNLIYLVSDGIETCDGDPVKIAKEFADSNVSPIINVIGFNVDSKAQAQLKQVAETSDGIYTTVTNKDQLSAEFDRAQDILERWESWKSDALSDADGQRVDNDFDIL